MVELSKCLGKAVRDEAAKEMKQAKEVVYVKPEDKPSAQGNQGNNIQLDF